MQNSDQTMRTITNRSCRGWEDVPVREGGGGERARDSRVKWCKNCVHMYVNAKMIPVETIPEMGGGEQ
jgi:hypothetical protein